jgi:uncharacterized membrane protein YuzA (DUF378 family)
MKHLHLLCIILLLVGGINWGLVGLFNFDLVKYLFPRLIQKIIYVLVGLAAICLAVQRDTYLPFLGYSVFPSYLMSEKIPSQYNLEIPVHVKPNVFVAYWAATEYPGNTTQNWKVAYDRFQNSGITRSDENGLAILKLNCPKRYTVGIFNRELYKHVHYRTFENDIWVSPVKTVNVEDECPDVNANAHLSEHMSNKKKKNKHGHKKKYEYVPEYFSTPNSQNFNDNDILQYRDTESNVPDTGEIDIEDKEPEESPYLDSQPENDLDNVVYAD